MEGPSLYSIHEPIGLEMKRLSLRIEFFLFGFAPLLFGFAATARGADIDFNRHIRPLLSDKCFACHGPDEKTREADLRLDDETSVFTDNQVIVRGNPDESALIERILSNDPDTMMPPPESNKALSDAEKKLLRDWISQGAPWAIHWAYVPPRRADVPPGVHPIDYFIRRQLRERGLEPSPPADRVTLIRRLYFDLLGLPPTPAQVDAFVNDTDPNAYEKVLEQLLQSPHHGERMAVYWLDVVRYADSNGYHSDEARQIAPYRDYVIESFHRNKPYDEFVVEQLAGDLLPEAGLEQQIASGFNMLLQTTSEGGAQAKEYIAKYAADRVRNTSQIFLGSTVGCAECHNHKFDPFTQADFYSFAAFFADIQQPAVGNPPTYPVITEEDRQQTAEMDRRIAELQAKLAETTPELTAAQHAWEDQQRKEVAGQATFGPWHIIGPFKGPSLDAVFAKDWVDPAQIDLQSNVEQLGWKPLKQLKDGEVFPLPATPNSARYLYRTVEVPSETKQHLSLGSDDTLTVWVNGQVVHNNKVSRGVAADQDKIDVSLPAGKSELLFRVCNGGGGHGFYFRGGGSSLPAAVAAALQVARDQRTPAQQAELDKFYRTIAPSLQGLRDEVAKVTAEKKLFLDSRPRTMMTKTGAVRTVRLLNRGNWLDESGPVMEPAIPEFMGALDLDEGQRANRLHLAQWIISRDNPLTARTFVNRLWKLYFGQGLATPLDDLGRQGTVPTHPELLDYLAVEFMESGWDTKALLKQIVMSQTYRQSSRAPAALLASDPRNRKLARGPRLRMDAETIRDSALAVSGLLVRQVGGPSVFPYHPPGLWQEINNRPGYSRVYQQDAGNNLYRRSLYTFWKRTVPPPSMSAFDAPGREYCVVRRSRTNTPLQAFVLLNDPQFVEAARHLGQKMMEHPGDDAERIEYGFQLAFARLPTAAEQDVLLETLQARRRQYRQHPSQAVAVLQIGESPDTSADKAEAAAWATAGRILLNLSEFITKE